MTQQAFRDMSEEELRTIIINVTNQKDPVYSNLESALSELQRRAELSRG